MKYWIIINNSQQGPLTTDELSAVDGFGTDTPVWHEGLTDWTKAGEIEELRILIEQKLPDIPQPSADPVIWPAAPAPSTADAYTHQTASTETEQQKPDTYLVWNIVATLACCIPTGIVGIVMSNKVNEAYARGDMQRARKMSERAAWWLLISIVLGLVALPFQILMQLAASSLN